MKFKTNDSTKREHAAKMNRERAMEQMQKHVSENAKTAFNRKPYQIGGGKNECNGKDAAKD